MLGQWGMKGLYNYILRKLIGKLIIDELDLEQLDVQLYAGVVELRDLQLNVGYVNKILVRN